MAYTERLRAPPTFVEFPQEKSIINSHICDIITTVVTPILLAVSLCLIIYYSEYPIQPMIPITEHFSITLPIMVCTPIAILSIIILVVQITRCKQIKISYREGIIETVRHIPSLQKSVTDSLYHSKREEGNTPAQYAIKESERIEEMSKFQFTHVELPTRDGINLNGYYTFYPDMPLVIYFHSTLHTLEDHLSEGWGLFYKLHGFNVLMVEYRGYGLSEGIAGGKYQEIEAYRDAEAAWIWARKQGFQDYHVIVHGFEKGCAYASALGYFYNLPHVILENPYTSYGDFGAHITGVDRETAKRVVSASFAQGYMPTHPQFPGQHKIVTDGFEVLGKVTNSGCSLFVIQCSNDYGMPEYFGRTIIENKYPNNPEAQEKYLAIVDGDHNTRSFFFDPKSYFQLKTFLYEKGFTGTEPEYTGLNFFQTFENS